jgi:hypothetical protein
MSGSGPDVPPPDAEAQAMLGELHDALAPDEMLPPRLVDVARGALAWRLVDEELAELTESAPLVGVRGRSEGLSFVTPDGMHMEIDVATSGAQISISGRVTPPGTVVGVAWENRRGRSTAAPVDESGLFDLDDVATGMLRFILTRKGAPSVCTSWLTL